MDSLGSLNAFVQAAEARSFTVAGRQLGVSSSAIGTAIARLEERLGVQLFRRSTRAITLTPEGALLLERCRRIFCEIEAAELELAQTQEAPRGKLRVSLPLVGTLMMPTIVAFMRAWPEIELDLDFTDRLVDVIEDGFDAVVRTGEVNDTQLMTRTLGTFRYHVIAAPDYLDRRGVPLTPDDLISHTCLHHRYPTSGKVARWPLKYGRKDFDIALPQSAVASSIEPLIYMVEQALGIACLPDFAIQEQLGTGRFIILLADHVHDAGTVRVLWPSSRHLSPKLRVFIDFMAQNLFAAAPMMS